MQRVKVIFRHAAFFAQKYHSAQICGVSLFSPWRWRAFSSTMDLYIRRLSVAAEGILFRLPCWTPRALGTLPLVRPVCPAP